MGASPTETTKLCWSPATELARRVRDREVSPTEIAETMIARIERVNPSVNAFVHFDPEQVLADAAALTRDVAAGGELGPLHGVPYSIKDLTAVRGIPLTFGLVPMKDNIADHDAAIVTRLRGAGGLFLGKTNTPESGYWGGTDNHLFGPTHNPWKHGWSAGGSSGGAAAAVAAGLGPLAEGSDGAGSVRIPAALCGVVGFKPSMGRIPQTVLPGRFNNWAYHGPITRTVADAALMLGTTAGPHPSDPMTLPRTGEDLSAAPDAGAAGLRVAYSSDLGFARVQPEIAEICLRAVEAFRELGATVVEATPGWGDPEEAMWRGVWVPGFAVEHDMFDWPSLVGQVDDNLIDLIAEGERTTAVDIGRADAFRGAMWDTFSAFMADYDVLVCPTLADAATPLGRFNPSWLDGEPLRRRLLGCLLTYPFNMLSTPAVTVPAGFTSDGRPVGLQIAGGLHADATVLRAAAAFEAARPWAHAVPDLG